MKLINNDTARNILALSRTNSILEKVEILKNNKEDEMFVKILRWLLDKNITTGISMNKFNKSVNSIITQDITTIDELMEYLTENKTGKDVDIANVKNVILHCDNEDEALVILEIITKYKAVGISANTFNEIFSDKKIELTELQLAHKYEDHIEYLTENNFPVILTDKLDGFRMLCKYDGKNIKLLTRNGKSYENLIHINANLNELIQHMKLEHNIDKFVLDGELLIKITDENKHCDSKTLYKQTSKILKKKDGVKIGIDYNVFEYIPYDEFEKGESTKTYGDRRAIIHNILRDLNLQHIKLLRPIAIDMYNNIKLDIPNMLKDQLAAGKEGFILNNIHAKYVCDRTKNVLKLKSIKNGDVRVIGYEIGDKGRLKGRVNKVRVEYDIDGSTYNCLIGSGISNAISQDMTDNFESKYLGKIFTVQYMEVTENESGGKGLRHGVWLDIPRDDKDETNIE
ncbi:MAG: RNA ligase family protein [Aeromonas jandaei]